MSETTSTVETDTTDDLDEPKPVNAHVYAPTPVATRREIVPEWVRDRTTRTAARSWAVSAATHWTLFHLIRIPIYAARLTARSPVGAARVTLAVCWWAVDAGSAETRAALVCSVTNDSKGPDALYRTQERHRKTVQYRTGFVIVTAFAVLMAALTAWDILTGPGQAAVVVLSVGLLGWVGRRADRPLTDNAAATAVTPRLSSDLIIAALAGLGLGKMNTAMRDGTDVVRFVAPITRSGPGWRADLDLPIGVTAGEIIDRRPALASGLRRPLGCVWPEVDPDAHEGRLVLYVADQALASSPKVEWPLTKTGTANVFHPIPIGVDQRGEPVELVLMYASGLIGAVPRMGKTFLLRLICLGAALDPRTESHLYNLKGGADFEPLANTAHTYRAGDEPSDLNAALTDLRGMVDDMRRRYRTVRALPRDLCPESKVTDHVASQPEYGLHPVLLAVDECQVWFEHPEHGKEFEALATDLVKRGPAVGIMAWFSTQRPDAKAIPPGLRDNAVIRLCLKVTGQPANDMVMGTGSYKAGYRATAFARKDLGIAWLVGEYEDPKIVRAAYVDNHQAEAVAVRARAAKQAGGWLSGLAAGQDPAPDTDTSSILDHILRFWPSGHDKVWCETIAERLADHMPDVYGGWTGEQITATVKPHGIATLQIKRNGQNRRGITLGQLTEALGDRLDPGQGFA